MTTISTGSRLHFGLFNAGGVEGHPSFGGLGLMIHEPRLRVSVHRSGSWNGSGPQWERAVEAARKVAAEQPLEVVVETCPSLHSGLGVGTQIAMAAGRAAAEELGITLENERLACIVGRGLRSGIGVCGFQTGGFIVDHGHRGSELSPTERIDWPEDWQIVLVRPHVATSWHGNAELRAFTRQRDHKGAFQTGSELRRHAGEVASALHARDFEHFGEELFRFNRLAGELFAEDQGGIYSSEAVEGIVDWFRSRGLRGVGQSSWGPTVFAVVDRKYAVGWRESAAKQFLGKADVALTPGAKSGFRIESS